MSAATKHLIFVNYRGSDEPWAMELVYSRMVEEFGGDAVFKAGNVIQPGDVYPPQLLEAAVDCPVMLVCIGPNWLTARDLEGGRRLDQADDWVRQEIAVSLKEGNRVVPVLLGDRDKVSVPDPAELPPDLADLVLRQSWWLTPGGILDRTMPGLIEALAAAVPALAVRRAARVAEVAAASSLTVRGNANRVAGAGAGGNRFGDRGFLPRRALPALAAETKDVAADGTAPPAGREQGLIVHGDYNRVAGPGAHDNDFGDETWDQPT